MTRRLLLVLAVLCAFHAAAQQHPINERGFKPEHVYDFKDFDTVNLFNGNLIASIPIGITYPVGSGVSYSFVLRYSGNVWRDVMWERFTSPFNDRQVPPGAHIYLPHADNGGLGWRLSFGELRAPTSNVAGIPHSMWRYITPDGAEHLFYDVMHPPRCSTTITASCDPATDGVWYTRDGSYLRLKTGGTNVQIVEFPSGERHRFEYDTVEEIWRLKSIYSAASKLTNGKMKPGVYFSHTTGTTIISDLPKTYDASWTITDSHDRTHTVNFDPPTELKGFARVSSVELQPFGGGSAKTTYSFQYATKVELPHPCVDQPHTSKVSLLTGITLPTAETWTFSYHQPASCDDKNGLLMSATLPTDGAIKWTWQRYMFALSGSAIGVASREAREGDDPEAKVLQRTEYETQLGQTTVRTCSEPASGSPCKAESKSVHHHVSAHDSAEFGLPYSKTYSNSNFSNPDAGNRYISTELYQCDPSTGTCTPKRVKYVQYEMDYTELCDVDSPCFRERNRRQKSERTLFLDDGDSELVTTSSEFDGLGKYRKTVSSAFGAAARQTFTTFNASAGTYALDSSGTRLAGFVMPGVDKEWTLSTYGGTWSEQDGRVEATETCFDAGTGFLKRKRSLAGTNMTIGTFVRSANDLLAVFEADADSGYTAKEEYQGGDGAALGNGSDLCAMSIPTLTLPSSFTAAASAFRVKNTFAAGVLQSKTYATSGTAELRTVDNVIDTSTGLISTSRDTGGVETKFKYDTAGRLEKITHPGGSTTTYTYTNAAPGVPAAVEAVTTHADVTEEQKLKYEFDPLGRLSREIRLMPDGIDSRRDTEYDFLGRPESVSVWGRTTTALPATVTTYDYLGRPLSVTAPDGSQVNFEHTGNRVKKRTSSISTLKVDPTTQDVTTQDVTTTVTEEYDGRGQLTSVTEQGGATSEATPVGANVTTEYDYDVQGRLTTVTANSTAATTEQQTREFHYDGRGLLTSEEHPESGTTSYTYNALGRTTAKTVADAKYNLTLQYDAADRPLNIFGPASALLKGFTYGTSGILNGRLTKAVRINYAPASGGSTIRVTETYGYDSYGRRDERQTDIETVAATNVIGPGVPLIQAIEQSVAYDEFGRLETIVYPECQFCGTNSSGSRTVVNEYASGGLKGVTGFVTLGYHPNGMWATRTHQSGAVDKQSINETTGMPRPSLLAVYGVTECAAIKKHPLNVQVETGATAELQVVAVAGSTFAWFERMPDNTDRPVAGDVVTTAPEGLASTLRFAPATESGSYWCRVTSPGNCVADSMTATVTVCTDARIIEPGGDVTTEVEYVVGTALPLSVIAEGTTTTYEWTKTNLAGGVPVTISTGSREFVWTVEAGQWGIDVKVTSVCAGVVTIVVRRVATIKGIECQIVVDRPFPTVIEYPPNFEQISLNFDLKDLNQDNWDWETQKNSFDFSWWVNGVLKVNAVAGATRFTTPFVGNGMIIVVEATGKCGTADIKVRRETFVFNPDNCPVPAFAVDPVEVGPESTDRSFTASSIWRTLKYTWYKGDAGNTRNKIKEGSKLNVSVVDPGTYWVRATSTCGTYADSRTLKVRSATCSPVEFLRQPESAQVSVGTAHTLSFVTSSSPAITGVTWYEGTDKATSVVIGTEPVKVIQPQRTARYFAVVTTANCGEFESGFATVRVTACDQIAVDVEPANVTYPVGSPARTLSIAATSAFPLAYQWFEGEAGDVSKPLATGAAAVQVSPSETTKYWVRVSITGGCAIDREITVTACKPLSVSNQPIGAVGPAGYRHWLAVESTGTNLSFQWYLRQSSTASWAPMIHATTRHVSVAPNLTTEYMVRVTSSCGTSGSVDSQTARISTPPTVPVLSGGGNVTKGTVKELNATSDGTFLRYQWYRGHDETQPIAGETSATFRTPPINADVTYWARVWSGDAWEDTNSVTFTVCTPRTVVVNQPASVAGAEVTLSIDSPDSNESYEWYLGESGNTSQLLNISTILKVSPTVTTKYWVRTKRSDCHADGATVTIIPCRPRINTPPASKMINPNEATTLSVAAEGNLPLTYQWYIGAAGVTTSPVPDSNKATIPVGPLTADTTYWVAVSSPAASCPSSTTNSATATVSVCKVPSISQEPMSAITQSMVAVDLTVTATATDIRYQWYRGLSGTTTDPVTVDGTGPTLKVRDTMTRDYWVRITGRCGTPKDSAAAKVSITPVIDTQPQSDVVTKNDRRRLTVSATGTQLRYQWYRGSGDAAPVSGETNWYFDTPPLTADASYWVRVWSGSAPVDSTMATLTVLQPRGIIVTQPSSVSESAVTLQVNGSASGETFQWYRGASGDVSTPISTALTVVEHPIGTTQYWVRTKKGTAQADSATSTVHVCTPVITANPSGKYLKPDESHAMTVLAKGTSPTYQWYYGNSGDTSQPITGQTQPTLSVTPQVTTSYWVRVSSPLTGCSAANTYANSATAVVTVCVRPSISRQPMGDIVSSTAYGTLDVLASGDALSYQWYEGAAGVTTKPVGTNSNQLRIIPGTTKSYWARITGTCGSVDSTAAMLSVLPEFTTHPEDRSVCSGQNAVFTAAASGDPATVTYQWQRLLTGSSTPETIAGNTTSVTVAATQSMQVWCMAKSGNSSWVSSDCATLTPNPPPTIIGTRKVRGTGGRYTLYVDVSSDDLATATFEWFEGQLGDTRFLISNSYYVNVIPMSTPAYYWVRVTSPLGCASTSSVTVP